MHLSKNNWLALLVPLVLVGVVITAVGMFYKGESQSQKQEVRQERLATKKIYRGVKDGKSGLGSFIN